MEPTFTPVKDPVGVFYHAKYNMLLVSSLAGDGVVLAYDLKVAELKLRGRLLKRGGTGKFG